MIDVNKHKYFLLQVLKDIYSDMELANYLGFKGGTALMFFYDLPRFSVDLDFNLLDSSKEKVVFEKVKTILLKYGSIYDEAMKFYGSVIVLDYGTGERKLKVEISNRQFEDQYEIKNLLGINIRVMQQPYMFAHKLCAMLDRSSITNRDIFDIHFFLKNRTPIAVKTVEARMQVPFAEYVSKCIAYLEALSDKGLLNGLGELMNNETKKFVKSKMRIETIDLLRFYAQFPIVY